MIYLPSLTVPLIAEPIHGRQITYVVCTVQGRHGAVRSYVCTVVVGTCTIYTILTNI